VGCRWHGTVRVCLVMRPGLHVYKWSVKYACMFVFEYGPRGWGVALVVRLLQSRRLHVYQYAVIQLLRGIIMTTVTNLPGRCSVCCLVYLQIKGASRKLIRMPGCVLPLQACSPCEAPWRPLLQKQAWCWKRHQAPPWPKG
jgi:hypothetical protein